MWAECPTSPRAAPSCCTASRWRGFAPSPTSTVRRRRCSHSNPDPNPDPNPSPNPSPKPNPNPNPHRRRCSPSSSPLLSTAGPTSTTSLWMPRQSRTSSRGAKLPSPARW
eukprot:scaffold3277_cov38-Phaeocystis_antarctica.AAC.3